MDVTAQILADDSLTNLEDWMERLNQRSLDRFGKRLRVALPPGGFGLAGLLS